MAIYHDADAVKHSPLHRAAYAERYKGGQDDMHAKQALSGIYRCHVASRSSTYSALAFHHLTTREWPIILSSGL